MTSEYAFVPILVGLVIVLSAAVAIPVQYGQNATAADYGAMVAGRHIAKGQISNVQIDSAGVPGWIQSGIWVLKAGMDKNNEPESVQFVAKFSMVMPDGNAMHVHKLYDFASTDFRTEQNGTIDVIEGTATVTMRDGPVTDVPVTIKVFNKAVIGIWIGPDKVDGHFGAAPIYGLLSTKSRTTMEDMVSMTGAGNKTDSAIISPTNFVSSVNNPYFTLTPGTSYTYETKTDEGIEKNIVLVTNETKEILGVTTTVVWDRVWLDEELTEETFDWYAQDKKGNVWYMGEDSKEYGDGNAVSTKGSWVAGVNGAEPGIIMEANPKVGDSYRQEYYKGEAEDMGDVISLKESVTVPYGTFTDCLQTRDWSKIDASLNEYKYYCTAVGSVVLEVVVEDGERSELIKVE